MIAPTGAAKRPHRILLQNPGPAVPDGAGGSTQSWTDLAPPSVSAAVEPATKQALERVAGAATASSATHIVTMPFHPGVTVATRIVHDGRTFTVTGVASPDERKADTVAVCEESL